MYKKGVRLVLTFFVLMSFWLVLSQNLQPASLLIGALFSLLAALLSFDFFIKPDEGMHSKAIRTIWLLLIYVLILIYEMFLASIDVVYRVITMDINPEVVMIKTDIKSDLGIVLLANSITLTPGTITIDIEGDHLYVHWLYARTTHFGHAAELIKGRFEYWLGRIFI